MVNYCCVRGCSRNSKHNSNLYFHIAPKDPERQKQWFTAAGRFDVLEKSIERRSAYRFCNRHFAPSSIKNKHLCDDALPTLCLPGEPVTDYNDGEEKIHRHVKCNSCKTTILGFRYKCLICDNFDLCSSCESKDLHPEHFMLRIPTPVKYLKLKTVIEKWHEYHKELNSGNCSSDDEPITKYKSYDSGIDLSDDVKESIRDSIHRSFESKTQLNKKKKSKGQKRSSEAEKLDKKQKTDVTEEFMPELVFADVNQIPSVGAVQPMEVKYEEPMTVDDKQNKFLSICFDPANLRNGWTDFVWTLAVLPVMSIRLSDDFSSLFVEVHPQKAFP